MSREYQTRLEAFAKINLHLKIGEKKEGERLHPLLSLVAPLSLADELELAVAPAQKPEISLVTLGADLPSDERNLAFRAAKRWMEDKNLPLSVSLRLKKRIPSGAGLGGGSSDAAAVLRGLQDFAADEALPAEQLLGLALELGSDVPYFLRGGMALLSSFGERVDVLGTAPPLPLILWLPDFRFLTAEAYAALDEERETSHAQPAVLSKMKLEDWARLAQEAEVWNSSFVNDFFLISCQKKPVLGELVREFQASGSFFARMSGSGPCLFALYQRESDRDAALKKLRAYCSEGEFIALSLRPDAPFSL